jgi:hypothetical protein
MKYLLLAVTLMSLSCNNDTITPVVVPFEGKWVEAVGRMDTIIFDPKLNGIESNYFIFKSHKGISGYNNLHSTIYEYNITYDQISIYNTISSCYCFSDYRFTQAGNKISVENFYDSHSKSEIETFRKLD